MKPEGPYHQTRTPSGRQSTLAPTSPPDAQSSLADEVSQIEQMLEKHMRKLKLELEHEFLASNSAELTMAKVQVQQESAKAKAAETRAGNAEYLANELARKSFWRGFGAIVATVGSVVALGITIGLTRALRSYFAEDLEATAAASADANKVIEDRIEATEKRVEELRTDMKQEIADQFKAIRLDIREALESSPPPAPKRKKKAP